MNKHVSLVDMERALRAGLLIFTSSSSELAASGSASDARAIIVDRTMVER